jgi:hypothetical protein
MLGILQIFVKPPDLIGNGMTDDLDMLNLDDLAGTRLKPLKGHCRAAEGIHQSG